MRHFTQRILLTACAGVVVIAFAGCDLLAPPQKAAKKQPVENKKEEKKPAVSEEKTALPDNIVAKVGSWSLTADDFNQRLKMLKQGLPEFDENDPQTKATVLNELIRQQLLVNEAEASDIGSQKEIKEAIEDFRRTVLVQELANRLTKGVAATEEEAQEYYNQNKTLFINWKVRQIVVSDEAVAKDLVVKILQGGDFAALAKENSKDKATASEGGLVADLSRMPDEVQKALVSMEAGSTSSVIKTPGGYYIVHVDEKKQEDFAKIKDELISGLTLRKQQTAIFEHINKLAEKNKVDVNEKLLGLDNKK